MSVASSQQFWSVEVRRLARTLNGGWFVSFARRIAVLVALLLGLSNVLFRVNWPESRLQGMLLLAGLLGGSGMVVAYLCARKRFITEGQARVRLEHQLGLHSALSAAAGGLEMGYPATPPTYRLPVIWRWKGVLQSLLVVTALGILSEKWPVSQTAVVESYEVEKSQPVRELEKTIEQLREQDALAEESLAEMEQKVQNLLNSTPSDKWFENSAMEAAEHLREQLQQDLQALNEQLQSTSQTLEAAQPQNTPSGENSKASQQGMLEALQQMQKQGLKPGENLSDLAKQAAEQMGNMTPEQQQALQDALQKNSQALKDALNAPPQEGQGQGDPIYQEGDGQGKGTGEEEGEGPGDGGVERGPGEAPMVLKQKSSETEASGIQAVESRLDLQRAALGDAIQERVVEHTKPQTTQANDPQHGGGARASSTGASAPTSPSLMPKEKAFLREVLK